MCYYIETRQNFEPEPEAEEVAELSGEIMFVDFLTMWLEIAKSTIKLTTYASYSDMTNKTIIPYFKPLKRKLSELTATECGTYDFTTCVTPALLCS